MRLDRFTRAADFLAVAGDYLADREAEHNLILGISSSLLRDPDLYDEPPWFAVVTDKDRVVATAVRTPPYNLLLSEVTDASALALLAEHLAGEALPGVTGPPLAVRGFADLWVAHTGEAWEVKLEERIYRLTSLTPPQPAGGGHRLATAADREIVIRWLVDFSEEALGDADVDRVRRGMANWPEALTRRFWFWEVDGEPAAMLGASGETPNGIRIGPVYTPPEHRGRGYASNLTAQVSQLLLDEGRRFCFLYTNLANPTANHIYQAIGYEPVTDALMIRFAPSAGA